MKLGTVLDQTKGGPEFTVKRLCVVANNFQATALGWPLQTKRCHDDVPTRFNRMSKLVHISGTLAGVNEKVENGAVMPYIELMPVKAKCQDIAADPVDLTSLGA